MAREHFLLHDLSTGIKIFVRMTLTTLEFAIFGGICVSQTHLVLFAGENLLSWFYKHDLNNQ